MALLRVGERALEDGPREPVEGEPERFARGEPVGARAVDDVLARPPRVVVAVRPEVGKARAPDVDEGERGLAERARALVRRRRRLVFADEKMREPEPLLERRALGHGNRGAEPSGDRERGAAVRDHGTVGEARLGLHRGLAVVEERAREVLTAREMVREGLVVLAQAVGVELLDGRADRAVQRLPALGRHALVGDLVREGVLEHVGELRVQRLLVDELEAAERLDLRPHAVAGLGDPLQEAQHELAADHGRDLDRALAFPGQTVEARGEHVVDRDPARSRS